MITRLSRLVEHQLSGVQPGQRSDRGQLDSAQQTGTDHFELKTSSQVKQLRETSKWILGVFGALGALLAAGIQISNAGKLDGGWRLLLAITGSAVGMIAIGAIIWFASRTLIDGDWTLEDLAAQEIKRTTGRRTVRFFGFSRSRYPALDYIEAIKLLPTKFPNVSAVAHERDAIREFRKSRPNPTQTDRETYIARRSDYDRAIRRLDAGITLALVRERFERAVIATFVCGAVAATAFGIFVWAINPPDKQTPADEFRVPIRAWLYFTAEGQRSHAKVLGPACVAGAVEVVVLSAAKESADVVTVSAPCTVARFRVDRSVGSLSPMDAVSIPMALASPLARSTPYGAGTPTPMSASTR